MTGKPTSDDRQLDRLKLLQSMLLKGATKAELAEACGVTQRTIMRYIDLLKRHECEIESDYTAFTNETAVYKMKKPKAASRLYLG